MGVNRVTIKQRKYRLSKRTLVSFITFYTGFNEKKPDIQLTRKRFEQMCSFERKPKIKTVRDLLIGKTQAREYSTNPHFPYVIFIHGGGHVFGSLKSHDIFCRRIAKYCPLNIISLEYSLAPEHQFPTQLSDLRNAVKEVLKRHGSVLYIAGDSAGGNLAAVLSHDFTFKAQFLFYPLVDYSLTSESVHANGIAKNYLTEHMLQWFRKMYVSETISCKNPEVSPIYLPNTTPTFCTVGSRDLFYDDTLAYAEKIAATGNTSTVVIVPHALHGFMQQPRRFGYRKVLKKLNEFLETIV